GEASWTPVQDTRAEGELDPAVPHAPDVRRHEVRQVRARRGGYRENQIVRALRVPVNGAREPLVEEAVVRTHVPALRRLPFDVRIDGARSGRAYEPGTELYLGLGIARLKRDVLKVVRERLVAGLSPRGSELEIRNRRDAAHERLA